MTVFSQDTTTIELAQVNYKNQWRIIDKKGNFMFGGKPVSYPCLCFTDKLAQSYQNKSFGFMDLDGKQVIPNKYRIAHCFVFGYAAVEAENGKWGIINRKDSFVVPPIYDFAGNFGMEGLAGVMQKGKIGFVDRTGKLIIPFKYYWLASFNVYPMYSVFTDGL